MNTRPAAGSRRILLIAGLALAGVAASKSPLDEVVVGRIGERAISLREVDERAQVLDRKTYLALYEVRKQALDALIEDHLLADQARREGIDPAALVEREITGKIPPVSTGDIETFYAQNEARMGGQSLAAMRDQIRTYLETQSLQQARWDYFSRLRVQAGVEIALEPPRAAIEVTADEPSKGPLDAPIQIVEFSEFQCSYCAQVGAQLQQVMDTYGTKIRLVFRDFPLAMHDRAHLAAQAAQCAHDQGQFWPYHDALFAHPQALGAADLKKHASSVGLDVIRFEKCLNSGQFRQSVDADLQRGQALGVTGTPAFFINGRFLSGAQPYEVFERIIDEELER